MDNASSCALPLVSGINAKNEHRLPALNDPVNVPQVNNVVVMNRTGG